MVAIEATTKVGRSIPRGQHGIIPHPGKFVGKSFQADAQRLPHRLIVGSCLAEYIPECGVDPNYDFDPLAMGGVAPTLD